MRQRCAGLLIALMLSTVGAWASQRVYEVGAVYVYYTWTSDAQIVRDLETIASTGIKAINPYPPFLLTHGHPEPDFSKADLVQKTAQRLGLRVVNFDGYPADARQRLVRFVCACLSTLAGLGLLWALFDEEKLTWYDHMSKTFLAQRGR